MVFFTCNFCNESLKKKSVESHFYICRRCTSLSCVDCGTEFDRQSYTAHIKCISEEEKYSGPNFQLRASANKGERKQEAWTDQVKSAIANCKPEQRQVHQVLCKIRDQPNVPRKKAKFHNFVRNIMHYASPMVIEQAWDLIAAPAPKISATKTPSNDKVKRIKEKDQVVTVIGTNGTNAAIATAAAAAENEKKRKAVDEPINVDKEEPKKKKNKKDEKSNGRAVENEEAQNVGRLNDTLDVESLDRPEKFDWVATMSQLITKKKGQISLKKLRKRTMAEFFTYPEATQGKSNNVAKIDSKFDKILRKNFILEDKYVSMPEN